MAHIPVRHPLGGFAVKNGCPAVFSCEAPPCVLSTPAEILGPQVCRDAAETSSSRLITQAFLSRQPRIFLQKVAKGCWHIAVIYTSSGNGQIDGPPATGSEQVACRINRLEEKSKWHRSSTPT
jgi:hypothetical protein